MTRALATIAWTLLLAAAGCAPAPSDGSVEAPAVLPEGAVRIAAEDGTWRHTHRLAATDGRLMAGVLFDLTGLPAGGETRRAVLRMRRLRVRGEPAPALINVTKGLRVGDYTDGDPVFGIIGAQFTEDKREMIRTAKDNVSGGSEVGLALTEYPVACSVPSQGYVAGVFRRSSRYGELLEKWNGLSEAAHRVADGWDEFDVTGLVRAARAGDGLLLVAVKVTGGELQWYHPMSRRAGLAPRLVVESDPAAAKPTPADPTQPAPPPAGAGRGRLAIDSQPSRADIYVDNRYVGTTPSRELVLPAGQVRLRIEKKGFKPWERTVTVLADNVVSVAPELEKE